MNGVCGVFSLSLSPRSHIQWGGEGIETMFAEYFRIKRRSGITWNEEGGEFVFLSICGSKEVGKA